MNDHLKMFCLKIINHWMGSIRQAQLFSMSLVKHTGTQLCFDSLQ